MLARSSDGDMDVGEDAHALPEVLVLSRDVRGSLYFDCRSLRLQDHHVTLDRGHLDRSALIAPENHIEFSGLFVVD